LTQLLVVNRDELVAVVAEAVSAAAHTAPDSPNLQTLTQAQLCKVLSISVPTLHRLRHEGLPYYRIGDSPRFDLTAVLAWLRARKPHAPAP